MGELRFLSAEISEGRCSEVAAVRADEPAPIGTLIQLYVLAALGEAVPQDHEWQDLLVVQERLKSIPPGVLQERPDGEAITVLDAADLMISLSDNTATDHLIDLLGGEVVETSMVRFGNSTPELNTPLLNTRELTALKVGVASGLRVQWLPGDEATRRSILDQISEITPADLPVESWVSPVDPDLLNWFATPSDLCDLTVGLLDLADSVPELAPILDPEDHSAGSRDRFWTHYGTEPGLLAFWFVDRDEGHTVVTAGSIVNSDRLIDEEEAHQLLDTIRETVAP
ncbi:MAG TPA: serine hydrolase [Acidimicrobiia bacterium]|nr:serine hydrolase [Acidimicrobiia bacterium]